MVGVSLCFADPSFASRLLLALPQLLIFLASLSQVTFYTNPFHLSCPHTNVSPISTSKVSILMQTFLWAPFSIPEKVTFYGRYFAPFNIARLLQNSATYSTGSVLDDQHRNPNIILFCE